MKKFLVLFLSCILMVTMAFAVSAADDKNYIDTTISFNLTVDGESVVTVPSGEEIEITYWLKNETANEEYNVFTIANEIGFRPEHFEIVSGSIVKVDSLNSAVTETSGGEKRVQFNGYYVPVKAYEADDKVIGKLKLKVLATEGEYTISNRKPSVSLNRDDWYKVTANDLTVIVGEGPETLYTVTYMNGENVFKTTQSAGETVITSAPTPAPDGYKFKGWLYDGDLYQPGDSFEVTEDVTFTAEWEEIVVIQNYTLTFNTNGGTAVSKVVKPEGTVIDLSEYTTAKTGFTFDGWYSDEALTEKVTSVTLNESMTVYAKWNEIVVPDYTLTFNVNGGSAVTAVTKPEGTVVELSQYNPTKDGFTFDGWYSDEALTNKVTSVTLDGNKTVYAKWNEVIVVKYTITFKTNGGTAIAPVELPEGTVVDLSDYVTTRANYDFKGWYKNSGLSQAISTFTLTQDMTVYAKWGTTGGGGVGGPAVTRYKITVKDTDGSELDTLKFEEGKEIKLMDELKFEKEGYVVEGFYTDKALTNKVETVKLSKDLVLYIKWAEKPADDGDKDDDKTDDGKTPEAEIPDNKPEILTSEHYAYIVGREGGVIAPASNITRAEVATIIFRLLNEDVRNEAMTKENSFVDVDENAWFNTAVSTLAALKLVNGRTEDTFAPNAYITRAELSTIFARMVEIEHDGNEFFSDVAGHWAESYIKEAAAAKWIIGDGDGTFRPDDNITRAEVMTLVNRVLNRLPESKDDLLEGMKTWSDNANENAWYYLAVQEATNSHECEMKEDGVHEKWTALTETPDWTELEK